MPRVVKGYKEAARSNIIKAALEVFSSKGYQKSTMDDVAEELGVSKGALYQYFKSKEDLLRGIQSSTREQIMQELRRSFTRRDPIEGAELFFDTIFEKFSDGLHTRYIFSLSNYDEKLRTVLREDHDKDLKIISEFLEELAEAKQINPKFDLRVLPHFFAGIIFEALLELALGDKASVKKKWVEWVAALFGIRCPASIRA